MDRFENGLSTEDNFDSWDIISDDCGGDDTQDFEIIKVLRELERPLNETESLDTIVLNNLSINNAFRKDTFTTDASGETTDEDYEDTKKSKQGIKKEPTNCFVEANASKLSTKLEHKFKRRHTIPDKVISKKKDENKSKTKKCSYKKSRAFINSANVGALLTAFGLSLIFLNSSDKTQTCAAEQESKNISDTLVDAINDTKIWANGTENILDEDKLLERFLPASVNKTILNQKSFKTKILKRIDRKLKQQIRGCDVKPIKKEKKLSTKSKTTKTDLIGPLTKDGEFYANNSSTLLSRLVPLRNSLLLANTNKESESSSSKTTPENNTNIDFNVSKTKADMMSKFLQNDVKKFMETPRNTETTNNNNSSTKKPNCSSIYRDFIKAETLFKKIMNNSYDIPKPKTPTDLAYNIENKINILTEDNINLSNIIEEQENLLRQIQEKIEHKKEILQKRSQQRNILQKRLKFANWMKQKREYDEQKSPKINMGERILNNIVTTVEKNKQNALHTDAEAITDKNTSTSKSTTEIATRYPLSVSEEKYKNKTEEETAIYVKRKLYLLRKHEDLQRNMETQKRKDEEHVIKTSKLLEKSDPKRAWTKKKTEF